MSLKVVKKELRTRMKQTLSALNGDAVRSQSLAIFKLVKESEVYQNANCIGIYLSMPNGEVQTDDIVRHALSLGKQVFVPYLHKAQNPPPDTPKSVMNMLELRSISDYDSLRRDSWGIPTIGVETVSERAHILENNDNPTLDLILVPGVAFSRDQTTHLTRRLGHGKGFYDYFLHRYREGLLSRVELKSNVPGSEVLLYGLALEEQFLPQTNDGPPVPVGEHDSLLHGLFVGNGMCIEGPQ
ncbi:hypothetical protein BJ878DRAFT_537540 [Calycina marina]|uniref:5-formyltetrahydrofolate cyclo-ligase n=1 Tax=Calycina marina TaxID=1763456 RepID=A0A9P7ZC18_9HELO|nr:hypothetical protein BJ878DRAFT_537540 [Calycina marina]